MSIFAYSSAYKIATIGLSLIHESDDRPSQTAPTLDNPAVQEGSVSDRAVEKSEGSLPTMYGRVSDPFGYKYDGVSELPSAANSSKPFFGHGQSDSTASIPSISSYGQIITGGHRNPFGYAASFKTTHTRDVSGNFDNSAGSYPDDSAEPGSRESVCHHKAHKSTDSDRSTFYFHGKEPPASRLPESYCTHKRDESITSLGPPVSLHNSSFRATPGTVLRMIASIAHAYSNYGANGSRAIWAKHQSDASVDSMSSDFSAAGVA